MDTLPVSVLDRLTVSADTIPSDVSPRKPDLVGLMAIRDLLTAMGKVNQETGEPLDDARVAALVNRMEDDGVKPVYGSRGSRNRLWYRPAVIRYFTDWDQTEGYPKGKPRVPKPKS